MRLNLKLIYIFLILLLGLNANAQTPQENTYTIAGVSVEGNVFADESTIITVSGLITGESIVYPGDNKLQLAVKNLWGRKQFSDVSIEVDRVTPVGIFLTIKVKEFNRLSNLIINGNKELSEKEVRKEFNKVRGELISPWDLYVAKRDLKAAYKKEDLFFTKIEMKEVPTDTNQFVNIELNIDEGVEFYTQSVTFKGNTYFTNSELEDAFDKTHTKKWWQIWRSAKFDTQEYADDKEKLISFFKREGFIDAYIVSDTLIFDEANEAVHIEVTVNEGNRYFLRNIEVEGNTVFSTEAIIRRLDFKKGEVYDQEKMQANISVNQEFTDALSLYNDNGYMFAQIDKREKRVTADSIDVYLRVNEGKRVKLRRVDIVGNSKTKDKVIRRELFTRPGDYFSRSAIIRSVRSLGMLNYFSPESLYKFKVNPIDEENVDITYNVEEQSTETINASIGYAGIYGLTASIGITARNFSLSEPLKGGGGQILNFNYENGFGFSQILSLGLQEPWLFDLPISVGFNLFDARQNYIDYHSRRTGAAINMGRRLKWPDDYFRADWSFRVQMNDVSNAKGFFSELYRMGRYSEITIGQTISRSSLNSPFFPTAGSRFILGLNWAMGGIGIGETDYLKTTFNYEFNEPILQIEGMDKLIFHLSTNWGYVHSFKYLDAISPIELFRMGGNGLGGYEVVPLRGYSDLKVGMQGGGRVMMKHVAELRFAVSQGQMPIFVFLFAEAGNTWKNLDSTDPFRLNRAAGVGIQLMMNPIGIIGFSYGYGFDPERGSASPQGWKFLFHLNGQ